MGRRLDLPEPIGPYVEGGPEGGLHVEVAVPDAPAIRRLQRLWLVFVVVAVGILAALPLLDAEPSDIPVALPATLAAAGGVGAFIAIVAIDLTFAGTPPASDVRALQEYQARTTLGFVLGQAPAVLGFALAFAFGQLLPAALGGAFALACLLRARPSVARLRRLETAWSDAGHDVSALRAAAAQPDRDPPQESPQEPSIPEAGAASDDPADGTDAGPVDPPDDGRGTEPHGTEPDDPEPDDPEPDDPEPDDPTTR